MFTGEERMVPGSYRSRIYPQGSHAGRHITSYRQQRVKDLPKVSTWRLEWNSNKRPSSPKASNTTTQPPRRYRCEIILYNMYLCRGSLRSADEGLLVLRAR